MIIYDKEQNGFTAIVDCIDELYDKKQSKTAIFQFVYDDKVIEAKYNTMFETDNGEVFNSPEYEEYNAIAFENLATHELFDLNYKNLPRELYCNGKRII